MDPANYGFRQKLQEHISATSRDGVLEMLKVAFAAVLATWMTACLMAIIYSREIAEFIFQRL